MLVDVVVVFQNRLVNVTSLGYFGGTLGAPPKVPIVWVPATSGGRWVRDEMEGDSDIVIEDVCDSMAC